MNRKRGQILALVLMVLAGWLLLSNAPLIRHYWFMEDSRAADRAGERMQVSFPNGSVAVNRASAQELEALPEIGPVTAQRMVEEREQNGPFFYPEDLLSVPGIGEKTLQEILSQIHLN